jgi:hypothetical protein
MTTRIMSDSESQRIDRIPYALLKLINDGIARITLREKRFSWEFLAEKFNDVMKTRARPVTASTISRWMTGDVSIDSDDLMGLLVASEAVEVGKKVQFETRAARANGSGEPEPQSHRAELEPPRAINVGQVV